jgi:pyruvate/2-oxoglutarate dehydrogenase complex dihydrolipoamide acyltransferase (E2) component
MTFSVLLSLFSVAQVTLQQAFHKVAASKGYSVISLREHEAASVCKGHAREKLDFLESLRALQSARGPPGAVLAAADAQRRAKEKKTNEEEGAGKSGEEGTVGKAVENVHGRMHSVISNTLYRAIFTAQPSERHMAPPFSADVANATVRAAAGEKLRELSMEKLKRNRTKFHSTTRQGSQRSRGAWISLSAT